MPALRAIYRAKDAAAGMKALEVFEAGAWGQKYPAIALSWRRNWEHVVPVLRLPRRGPPHRLHHERDRGAELKTAARGSNPRSLPQ